MSLTPEQVRARLLDYCMGLLSPQEEAQMDRALLVDGALAEEAQRIRELLSLGKRADAMEWTAARSEANFATIAAALASARPAREEAEAVLLPAVAAPVGRAGHMKPVAWIAAAAAILLGLASGLFRNDTERDPVAAFTAPPVAEAPAVRAAATAKPAEEVLDVWASLPRSASRPAGFPGSVFAGKAADWRAQSDNGWTLYVGSGALLVEWMPATTEHLVVRTLNETVEITGTVFAVDVTEKGTEVSIVEGSAVISPTEGASADTRIELGRGSRWQSAGGKSSISGSVQTAAGLRIDLAAHRAWMAARKQRVVSSASAMPKPKRAASNEAAVAQPPLDRLADEALARGEKPLAAALLEQWAEKAPAPSTRRAAKLDLARIYLYELHQPERGAAHLRDLIASAPSDSLAVTLRSELCSLRLPKDAPLCGAD